MGRVFWIKRFVAITALITSVLMVAELLKGHTLEAALTFSVLWGILSSAIFIGARIYHSRRGHRCAICRDTPDSE